MVKPDVFTVVLTGGIASGKTAVSDLFADRGVPVIDTDLIAREMVEPGQTGLQRIVDEFGSGFLDSDGRLDRRRMRQAIFSSEERRKRLESILHPLISAEVLRSVGTLQSPYCLIVIPLYAESRAYSWIDRVLVVDVSEEVQIERVMARDRIRREQAVAILQAQARREERLALADDMLDNSGSRDELAAQVDELHRKYLEMSA